MKLSEVLVKPVITEKSNKQAEKSGVYTFKVNRNANKLEIKSAIQSFYGVSIAEVNTMVVPGKAKPRSTKAGIINGLKPAYKKAYVKVAEGESIDLYATI